MSRSTWRRQAVDYFSFNEIALKVSCDIVDASDAAAFSSGVGKETTRRVMGQCLGESLIVVDSGLESAALHTEGGRAASRPCEGSQPAVRGAGLLAGRAVKGVS